MQALILGHLQTASLKEDNLEIQRTLEAFAAEKSVLQAQVDMH